ncbi:hypothetical protein BRD16_05010 [Halobacteriales archaeon SW_6_65_46]|nr:MAG: hypothetical protein BRD16_05010 [Halobacteriales archaeon SW_6_65_46]
MSDQSSNSDSLKSRLLFFAAGIIVAALLFTLDIGGVWALLGGSIAFILFGEAYLSLTGD